MEEGDTVAGIIRCNEQELQTLALHFPDPAYEDIINQAKIQLLQYQQRELRKRSEKGE